MLLSKADEVLDKVVPPTPMAPCGHLAPHPITSFSSTEYVGSSNGPLFLYLLGPETLSLPRLSCSPHVLQVSAWLSLASSDPTPQAPTD